MSNMDLSEMERRDVIDSRDVIARIEELEAYEGEEDFDAEDAEELRQLRDMASDGETVPDWPYGATLVRESYFEQYARELADDLGLLEHATSWPLTHIDWKEAANELMQDYTPIEGLGTTWLLR